MGIAGANHQLKFFDAALAQPVFGGVEDGAAVSRLAVSRIDRDVLDIAAMSVVADHYGGDDGISITTD